LYTTEGKKMRRMRLPLDHVASLRENVEPVFASRAQARSREMARPGVDR